MFSLGIVGEKGPGHLNAAPAQGGKAQLEYDELKKAVLQKVGRSPEQHRQQFRMLTLREFDRPFVLVQQRRDSCRRWLLSKERDSEEVLDLVVLEQFITCLPEETAAWVQCHQPESLDEATKLAEAHMAAYSGAGAPTPKLLSPSLSLPIPAP
uniref:SCAN box domain-containing protein n=1 Tax=Pygocentrus nattereri TaxID=42514 RepID=A0AAR2IX28_PYGNA